MSIHSVEKGGKARTACRLLANKAINFFDDRADLDPRSLKNLIRLLERYRHGVFPNDPKPSGVLERGEFDSYLETEPLRKREIEAVKAALKQAHKEVFQGDSSEEVVMRLEDLLEHRKDHSQHEFDEAKKFFVVLKRECENLKQCSGQKTS